MNRDTYFEKALSIVDQWEQPEQEQILFRLNTSAGLLFSSVADFLHRRSGTYNGVHFDLVRDASPRVLLLSDVLQPSERQQIIAEAISVMQRSEVVGQHGKGQVNSVRTSFGMFITSTIVAANEKLRSLVASLAGVPVENIEATQVLRYEPGQFYRAHPDYFWEGQTEHLNRGGQRFATVLTWLNDVENGGETSFPQAQGGALSLKPRAGSSILFYNVKPTGEIDVTSMHEAHPPTNGSVCWIRPHKFT
jgi:prolyl 4-hydroxylase